MVLVHIERDSAEVVDEVRRQISAMAKVQGESTDPTSRHDEWMYVIGWIAALGAHGLLNTQMTHELQNEQLRAAQVTL